jgi:MFS family permease
MTLSKTVVRHNTAFQVGLLLGPQGIGAALALPLAGKLTDKIGARAVASAGMVTAMLGTLAYTQVSAGTSYLYLAAALLVTGAGIGATLVPAMAAGFLWPGPRGDAAGNQRAQRHPAHRRRIRHHVLGRRRNDRRRAGSGATSAPPPTRQPQEGPGS